MTESASAGAPAPAASAGALLRQAREAQGLHIAALAASLKVPPRRLEALEQDRWGDLPDPAFTRALAQSVCRALKRDPAPVLALLPRADGSRLDQVAGGINAPFRERPAAVEPGVSRAIGRPVVWVVALLLVAALAVLLWPASIGVDTPVVAPADAPALGAPQALPLPLTAAPETPSVADPSEPAEATEPAETPVPADPAKPAGSAGSAEPGLAAGSAPAAGDTGALLVVRASAETWVEANDASGRRWVSRTLQPGESVRIDAPLPLQLTVGNAAATEVLLRGQPVDLAPHLRGNIARLELR